MKHNRYPWPMLASIYITQYIGVAFIMSAAMAILRQQGVSLDKLALLNLAALPLAGKVFYAPIIDKYRFLLQGQYRSWLSVSQGCMAGLLIIAGLLSLENQFHWIVVTLALYVFCMSIQDVAVDGLSCKLFDPQARKLANSIQFSGNLLGNVIGGGLILILYPWLAWQGSLWLLAGLTGIALAQVILFHEPLIGAGQQQNVTQQIGNSLWRDLKTFVKTHRTWFVVLALFPVGATWGFALLNPLLVDSGWSLDDIGFATKIYGSIVGLIAALLATPVITAIGRVRALILAALLQSIALLLIVPLTLGVTGKLMVYSAITVHFISFPALLVITSTMIMDNTSDTGRKATFFTLQFSFASLLGFMYSAMSMALAKHFGYSTVVICAGFISLAIVWLIAYLLGTKNASCKTVASSSSAPAINSSG